MRVTYILLVGFALALRLGTTNSVVPINSADRGINTDHRVGHVDPETSNPPLSLASRFFAWIKGLFGHNTVTEKLSDSAKNTSESENAPPTLDGTSTISPISYAQDHTPIARHVVIKDEAKKEYE